MNRVPVTYTPLALNALPACSNALNVEKNMTDLLTISYERESEFVAPEAMIQALKDYARHTLYQMQRADPAFADCWTTCSITMNGLQPEFAWGSEKDMEEEEGDLYVTLLEGEEV